MRYCMFCGMPMEDDDVFCTRCGKSTPRQESVQNDAHGQGPETLSDVTLQSIPAEESYDDPYNRREPEGEPVMRNMGRAPEGEPGMRGMGYVQAGPGPGPAGPRARTGGGKKRPDPSRYILIASAVILVVVLGILLSLLVGSGKKDGDGSGQEVASYENGDENGAGNQKLNQGQAQPEVGQESEDTQDSGKGLHDQAAQASAQAGDADQTGDAGGNGGDAAAGNGGDAVTAPEEEDRPTQLVSGQGEPEADPAAQSRADEEEDLTGQSTSDGAGDESGWTIDEDGNEVYYADGDAENPDSDQTDVGGGGDPVSRDGSYIIPGSDSRYLTRQELETFDDYTLQMAINELYARHGRKFDTESIRNYFEAKSWYHGTIEPADFDGREAQYFNQYELANRELMTKIREERGATLTW